MCTAIHTLAVDRIPTATLTQNNAKPQISGAADHVPSCALAQAALQEAIRSGQQIDLTEQPDDAELAMATARIEREEQGEEHGAAGAAGSGAPTTAPRDNTAVVRPLAVALDVPPLLTACSRRLCFRRIAALGCLHTSCVRVADPSPGDRSVAAKLEATRAWRENDT